MSQLVLLVLFLSGGSLLLVVFEMWSAVLGCCLVVRVLHAVDLLQETATENNKYMINYLKSTYFSSYKKKANFSLLIATNDLWFSPCSNLNNYMVKTTNYLSQSNVSKITQF